MEEVEEKMTREEIKELALEEQQYHSSHDDDKWIDGFSHAFEWAETHGEFMTNDKGIELIDAIKVFCGLTGEQVYPVVSFMCRNNYIKDWDCIDDVFYINGKQVAP